ncbi:hypothetical protein DH2020_025534 [Rehmannia glutinosa]|uniref:Reverse transcriptase n=1 Tax=Rehmannia glutinosa TaxID=99300 RepID=A0ABR0VZF7_REHGL
MWHYTKNKTYTVKFGYHVAKKIQESQQYVISLPRKDSKIWIWAWHLDIPHKIKLFLWKCLKGILPVKNSLQRRGVRGIDPICNMCGMAIETDVHTLRDCPWVAFMWEVGPLHICTKKHNGRGSLVDWIIWETERIPRESHDMFVTLLWSAWYGQKERSGRGSLPIGGYKINSDASIMQGQGTRIGAIIRDHGGCEIEAVSKRLPEDMEVIIAEATACKEGIGIALEVGIRNVVIETDNLQLFQALRSNESDFSYLGNIVEDIKSLLPCFISYSFSWVRRSGNVVAHNLARHAFSLNLLESVQGDFPPNIVNLILEETPH